MAQGLAVSDVVNVTVTISPTAAATRNFGAGLIIGATDVIDVGERIRSYANMDDVAADFGSTDPEYLGAERFFSQDPQPALVYVGRWAQTASHGTLRSGVLTASEQLSTAWTSITDGAFKIDIDGTTKSVSGLNFSAISNMPAVAAIVNAGLTGATVTWDANSGRFVVKSDTTGTSSTVGYAVAPDSGTDLSDALKLTSDLAGAPVPGVAAESLTEAVEAFVDRSGDWYAAMVLPTVSNAEFLAAAQLVEALGKKRLIGTTITSTTVLDNTLDTDLASVCKAANLKRTFLQYSSTPYAICSFFGRAATVDFTGSKTTLTMMFKVEPSVTAETLTETQAATLKSKHCNVFVNYDNSTAIIQNGVMANGYFFDSVHGWDWFENYAQTGVWNLLYTSKTKVPQTNAGMSLIAAKIESCFDQAVRNGLVAPGQWNGDGFGSLEAGDYLDSGYYVHHPDISTQSQADREARKSVTFQCAATEAGAVHSVAIAINVQR